MIKLSILLAVSSLLLGAQYVPRERPPGTDGQYHPTVESSHAFECGTIRAELRYRQERLPEEDAPSAEDRLRVTLLELSVFGRPVSASDLESAASLVRSFAWIQDVRAMCFDRRIYLDIKGMPLRSYIASMNNEDVGDTPELELRSIRLSREGIEYMSPER